MNKVAEKMNNGKFPLFPKLIATSFGAGFLPLMPGTWGALFGIAIWLPLYLWASSAVIFGVTCLGVIVFTILGTWASSISEKYWGKDPVIACVDETVGQWISLLPILSVNEYPWWEIIISFVLFRFFDIAKPLGIRSMERLPKGYGMMADDILSGIYAAIILLVLNYFVI